MSMIRYFYISPDLDDLERFEEELEQANIVTPQIHLLTLDDADAERHKDLHLVSSLMKKDIVHSTLVGAVFGIAAALLILLLAYWWGWTQTRAGWLPFIFLSVALLGFFTWQGGLWGIQAPNVHFRRFSKALDEGKHVFFVDLDPEQADVVEEVARNHPTIETAGVEHGAPRWIVFTQHHVKRFFQETFP